MAAAGNVRKKRAATAKSEMRYINYSASRRTAGLRRTAAVRRSPPGAAVLRSFVIKGKLITAFLIKNFTSFRAPGGRPSVVYRVSYAICFATAPLRGSGALSPDKRARLGRARNLLRFFIRLRFAQSVSAVVLYIVVCDTFNVPRETRILFGPSAFRLGSNPLN